MNEGQQQFEGSPLMHQSSFGTVISDGCAEHNPLPQYRFGSPKLSIDRAFSENERFTKLPEEIQLQLHWDQAACRALNLPIDGYERVSVLLVKWRKQEDQLNTASEVEELSAIFRENFGFVTEVFDLSGTCTCTLHKCSCSAQSRLTTRISRFLREHDNDYSLCLVYYTGHGVFDESNHVLELHASNKVDASSKPVKWQDVEKDFITQARGDILAIMDACYAGHVENDPHLLRSTPRTYQFLAACAPWELTESPGPRSFTAALIKSLQQLLDTENNTAFTTHDLFHILRQQKTRLHNPPLLIHRSAADGRPILLSQRVECPSPDSKYFKESDIPAYLTLRIELTQEAISNKQITDLASAVASAVRESTVGTRRVDFLQLIPRKAGFKQVVNKISKALKMAQLLKPKLSRKPTIETMEGNLDAQGVNDQPGYFAVFGSVSRNMDIRAAAISLPEPWLKILGTALGSALVGWMYLIVRSKPLMPVPGRMTALLGALFNRRTAAC